MGRVPQDLTGSQVPLVMLSSPQQRVPPATVRRPGGWPTSQGDADMDDAIRLLATAVDALYAAVPAIHSVEYLLAQTVEEAAMETEAVLALIKAVDW